MAKDKNRVKIKSQDKRECQFLSTISKLMNGDFGFYVIKLFYEVFF